MGDKQITKEDLVEMLAKADKKMKITLEESEKVVGFIDDSGDGVLTLDELEKSINEYRRYLWEKDKEAKRALYKEQQMAPPLFNRREVLLCLRALDMCGAMDGRVAVADIESAMKRAKEGSEDYRSIFEERIEEGLLKTREIPQTVAVVVPERERSVDFADRYKVLVVDNETAKGESESLFHEAKEIGGEVVMLRFSDDANGMSVVGVGGEKEIGGFFSPNKLKNFGVRGNWSSGSETEKINMCKSVGKRLYRPVNSDSLELQ